MLNLNFTKFLIPPVTAEQGIPLILYKINLPYLYSSLIGSGIINQNKKITMNMDAWFGCHKSK